MKSAVRNSRILYLYRLLTGSILAHEMMHAWLRLKGTVIFPVIKNHVENLGLFTYKKQFQFSFFEICVHIRLLTRRWKTQCSE